MFSAPLVSVVIATFNRARVLTRAIESVRRSTLADWELIVVGDCCTDDTATVVAAYGDRRITFVNLPANAGEQSGPNNEGLRRARGRFVAFLNHDDLYFPDHLATLVAFCERVHADLVWSPLLVALPEPAAGLHADHWRCRLSGVPPADDYDPRVFVFASAWLLTRELAERIGPWRPARETFVSSSQDWLFRAWRAQARMRFHPQATVFAVPASARAASYATAASPGHDFYAAAMRDDPRFRDTALERAAITGERDANRYRFGAAWAESARGLLFRPVAAAAMAVGVHPYAPILAVRYGRRGNLVSALRRRTGLPDLRRRP